MDRKTVLSPTSCDPRSLPLGAIEAFFLSQIDGHLSVEEIAEVVGLDPGSAITLAKRLVELGAARSPRTAPTRREIPAVRRSLRPARVDPRAEAESIRPPRRESKAKVSMRPPPRQSIAPEGSRREPRKTRRSLKMAPVSAPRGTVTPTPAPASEEPCELDDATIAMLRTFEAQIDGADHFTVLGIDRGAEKKAVKSAYYALAAKFHPDRFFKKKLGAMRATIEKIFRRVTDAHDVLTDAARRETYERTLPPPTGPVSKAPVTMPSARPSKAPPSARPSKAPPSARPSKAPPSVRASKASMPKVTVPETPPPPSARPSKAPARPSKSAMAKVAMPPPPPNPAPLTKRSSAPRIHVPNLDPTPVSKPAPPKAVSSKPAPVSKSPPVRILSADARRRVELFVQAGDEALRANDVIGAANHYRVALQNSSDPALRAKLEMVEGMAKERRFEVSLPRARTAEREQRWAEAAFEYARAHAARPTAELAERTAHALRMSEGDLGRAVELAEWAVGRAPRSLEFRLTLADVCLAARKLDRAAAECEAARTIAPNDARVGTLHAAVNKAIRTARGS